MRCEWPIHDIAVITLELGTACSVGSGKTDYTQDAPLAVDANELPYLPGTTLTGVLRRVMRDCLGVQVSTLNRWLGFAANNDAEGEGLSQVTVHDGCVHDSENQPVEGLRDPGEVAKDTLLVTLRDDYVRRQRNRHSHRGVSDHGGLFERTMVPKGCRFTFELRTESRNAEEAKAIWDAVQRAVHHPAFRLGGGTRTGLGRVGVIGIKHGRCDMRVAADQDRRLAWPHSLRDLLTAGADLPSASTTELFATPTSHICPLTNCGSQRGLYTGYLNLRMQGYWRIGQATEKNDSGKGRVLAPCKEAVVIWKRSGEGQESATWGEQFVIAASAIKGVLAHRAEFHARRLALAWDAPMVADATSGERSDALNELFGHAMDNNVGQVGRFWLDDVYLPADSKSVVIGYTAVDGLSQGALNKSLRHERLLLPTKIEVPMTVWHEGENADAAKAYPALLAALNQLFSEQLSIGGHGAAGHGLTTGSLEWASVWSLASRSNKADSPLRAEMARESDE